MFMQGDYEGVGHAVRTVHKGIRSTSANFVHNYEKTNLTEGREYKAVGVEAHDDTSGQLIIIKARKEIILSAGAYNSPMILMHSGIGPREHLTEMGISCKIDLQGVGSNLQDHTSIHTCYEVNDPSLTLDRFVYHSPDALQSSTNQWLNIKTGVMAGIPFGLVALKRIDKTIQDPVWKAAQSKKQINNPSDYDPTGQLPNQPHIEFFTTEMCFVAPEFLRPG
ncbi:unnamed protein product [Rotaria sordida]|uniref:Glucose-methanol-choline oxidoreductase N-terminal domain-containing protein n=1 Tax=Rotaria sordida TaxID=392033 RepID=A0A814C9D1_9BILA|nr:unnamed protein product [Rotaria sordida]